MITIRHGQSAATESPSVYFTAGYGQATVAGSATEWVNLQAVEGNWQMPLTINALESGDFEASSPYGYSGIFSSSGISAATLSDLWDEAKEELRNRGVVSLFLRFAPFDLESVERSRGLVGLTLAHVSNTIIVPTADSDSIWSNMQGRARTAVRKAERLGMLGSVQPATDEDLLEASPFRTLYENTMRRVQAAAHHYYPDAHYTLLRAALGDALQVATVRNSDGDVAAAALIMVDKNVVHYHLSGSNPVDARNGANNLLLWTILQWSANRGSLLVHLGGGVSNEDSLYKFKASFGGTALPFTVGKAIINPGRYDALVKERAHVLGISQRTLELSNYFPSYRAKVSSDLDE